MALNGLYSADVPLRNCSLAHPTALELLPHVPENYLLREIANFIWGICCLGMIKKRFKKISDVGCKKPLFYS